ncbi:MAG: thioredoxin family protein [bacterium]|nr:thioredoxin family protein [bacterium]
MMIKILGSGCPNCQRLENQARQAIGELKKEDAQVEHVYDMDKIIAYGVMSTPALVIDEVVKSSGRIPDVEEIKEWLQ